MSNFNIEHDGLDDDLHAEVMDEATVLAELKAELSQDAENKITWYPVPARPNIHLGFNTSIEYDLLRAWFKRATDRRKKELKPLLLASIVLSNQTRAIKIKGSVLTKDGVELTLRDEDFFQQIGVTNIADALKQVMVSEGHIIALMQQVLEDAGWGDVDMEADDNPLEMN